MGECYRLMYNYPKAEHTYLRLIQSGYYTVEPKLYFYMAEMCRFNGKFNEAVQGYNTMLRRFPNSIIAGICGFDKKGYFTAPEGSDEPVQVEFNF